MKVKYAVLFILVFFCFMSFSGCSGLEGRGEETWKVSVFGEKEEKAAVSEVTVKAEATTKAKVTAETEEVAIYKPEIVILNPAYGLLSQSVNELSGYEKYPSSKEPVFEEVEFDKKSLRFSEIFNDFDIVTANPEAFRKAAADGNIKLYLRGEVFELEFDKVETSTPKIIMEDEKGIYTVEAAPISSYRGKVVGIEDSRVSMTVGENVVIGSVDIGYTTSYCIEQTNQTLNGKVIHVIYSSADYKPRRFTEYPEL